MVGFEVVPEIGVTDPARAWDDICGGTRMAGFDSEGRPLLGVDSFQSRGSARERGWAAPAQNFLVSLYSSPVVSLSITPLVIPLADAASRPGLYRSFRSLPPEPVRITLSARLGTGEVGQVAWWQELEAGTDSGKRVTVTGLDHLLATRLVYEFSNCHLSSFRSYPSTSSAQYTTEELSLLCDVSQIVTPRPDFDAWFAEILEGVTDPAHAECRAHAPAAVTHYAGCASSRDS